MIFAFPDQRKVQTDVLNVQLDWTNILASHNETALVASHSAWAEPADPTLDFGEGVPSGTAMVQVTDSGMTGYVQTVQLAGGYPAAFTVVSAQVVLSDGSSLTRSFIVRVE